MKIYASKRNKTDDDIFMNLVDTGCWVKVIAKDSSYKDNRYAMKYICLFKDIIGLGYYQIDAYFIDNYDKILFHTVCYTASNSESYTDIDALREYVVSPASKYYFWDKQPSDKFELIKPLEIYTIDELFDTIRSMYGYSG